MKTGFIAITGRPNAGKSSLTNALVGEKVSIVSPKAQTTRDRICGILTEDDYQMVFVDTPGVFSPKNLLGEYMEGCVSTAITDADAVAVVIDGSKRISESDIEILERRLKGKAPVYIVLNKTDIAGFNKIYPLLDRLKDYLKPAEGRHAALEIIPLSAKTGENVEVLKNYLITHLKEGQPFFPLDEYTDKSERYMICETVREKALNLLGDEIPHGIGVTIQSMNYDAKGTAHIMIDITAEKDSHKAIILGAKGAKIKEIATNAREDIEKLLGTKVYMEIFVKVRDGWRDNSSVLNDLGYNKNNK